MGVVRLRGISRASTWLRAGFVCLLVASMGGGTSRAIEIDSLGKLVVIAAVKGDAGVVRPLDGIDFDLTCTTPSAFSVRLRTDAEGRANTYARPGKCLLTSRAPVRIDGKSYSWRGNVELFRGKETSLELSDDNASMREGEATPSVVEPNQSKDLTPTDVLPEVIFKVEPKYPPRAKQDRRPGTVVCQAVIGDDGYVRDVKVMSSTSPLFNESAIRAVSQRRYLPAQRAGRAIAVYFTVKVDFKVF
jgi:TonB family protein